MYKILLYYKYTEIKDTLSFMNWQRGICQALNLKGRIIIATEGINGTVEGTEEATNRYIEIMHSERKFHKMDFKISDSNGQGFPKLSIKIRSELVAANLGKEDVNPNRITGKHLSPDVLHDWIKSGKEFYIVDMRNDYEHRVGHFKDSILPKLTNFRDLPNILPDLEKYKDKTVVTVCTGGVRCEKASGYLLTKDFKDVYQLENGIVSYMEKYPNEDFHGQLYVFDGRITMGYNLEDKNRVIIGKCEKCNQPSENYVNCGNNFCHKHFIECPACIEKQDNQAFCSEACLQLVLSTART